MSPVATHCCPDAQRAALQVCPRRPGPEDKVGCIAKPLDNAAFELTCPDLDLAADYTDYVNACRQPGLEI